MGTMPHALIGYAGSTVRAAEMFRETFPDEPMTVLVDYFGREISDAVAVCRRFPDLAADGRLAFRMDTPGGRYCEGLDLARSYEVLERHAPQAIRGYRTEEELRHLVGTGVTAAAIWQMREALTRPGFRGPDRRQLRLRPGEMPHDGRRQRADRRDRHRLLPAARCGPRPTPRPTSSPMTASRWSRPAASSCCAAALTAPDDDLHQRERAYEGFGVQRFGHGSALCCLR